MTDTSKILSNNTLTQTKECLFNVQHQTVPIYLSLMEIKLSDSLVNYVASHTVSLVEQNGTKDLLARRMNNTLKFLKKID